MIKLPGKYSKNSLFVLLANLVFLSCWVWLYRGVYPYLGTIFSRQEFRTNQILLIMVLILIGFQIRHGKFNLRLDKPPQLYIPAIILVLVCSMGYLIIERYLDINTFSSSLFGLATYGLLGLWMRTKSWRNGLPAVILLVGVLPFGEHMQTFIGYPVRLMTAEIIRAGLIKFGIQELSGQSIGVNTLLVFESGMTKVDLPCSGVKSLWTGGLFLIAATWIEQLRINHRWLFVAGIFSVLLLLANLVRVAALVLVGQVAGFTLMAEMLHVPLGVLGFVGACGAALLVLRWTGAKSDDRFPDSSSKQEMPRRPMWLMPILTSIVLIMAYLYTPRAEPVMAVSPPEYYFPDNLQVEYWPLSPQEAEWLLKAGVTSTDRWWFKWKDGLPGSSKANHPELSGSMLLVSSHTWRDHHRPEACLEVYGLSIETSYTALVSPNFPVRVLTLEVDGVKQRMNAVYWLQSSSITTDEYASRIWADLAPDRQKWILVTILFDASIDPGSEHVVSMLKAVQGIIQLNLEGGL